MWFDFLITHKHSKYQGSNALPLAQSVWPAPSVPCKETVLTALRYHLSYNWPLHFTRPPLDKLAATVPHGVPQNPDQGHRDRALVPCSSPAQSTTPGVAVPSSPQLQLSLAQTLSLPPAAKNDCSCSQYGNATLGRYCCPLGYFWVVHAAVVMGAAILRLVAAQVEQHFLVCWHTSEHLPCALLNWKADRVLFHAIRWFSNF